MKTKLLFLLIALLSYVNLCMAEDNNGLPISVEPSLGNPRPHRSAIYGIYGVYNTITQTLSLSVNEEVEEINIYKDGVLIVSDYEPILTVYDLSAYGTGTYQVEVITENGIAYIGYFSYNQQ